MHPGVGTAATYAGSLFATIEFLDNFFQLLLHGPELLLPLPAEEVGTVVTDGELNVPHRWIV